MNLREDAVLAPLDAWLAEAFAPEHLAHSLAALWPQRLVAEQFVDG